MRSTHCDCPHCGAKRTVLSGARRRLLLPVAWAFAFVTLFGFALTTMVLLVTAPILIAFTGMLVGGTHAWVEGADVCSACGKWVDPALQTTSARARSRAAVSGLSRELAA